MEDDFNEMQRRNTSADTPFGIDQKQEKVKYQSGQDNGLISPDTSD